MKQRYSSRICKEITATCSCGNVIKTSFNFLGKGTSTFDASAVNATHSTLVNATFVDTGGRVERFNSRFHRNPRYEII